MKRTVIGNDKNRKNWTSSFQFDKPIDLVVSLTTHKFRIGYFTLKPVLQHMFAQNFSGKNVHYVVTVTNEDYKCFSQEQLYFLK